MMEWDTEPIEEFDYELVTDLINVNSKPDTVPFLVGQKVIIRNDLNPDCIYDSINVSDEMEDMAGETVTIRFVEHSYTGRHLYRIEENGFQWSHAMFSATEIPLIVDGKEHKIIPTAANIMKILVKYSTKRGQQWNLFDQNNKKIGKSEIPKKSFTKITAKRIEEERK